MFPDSVAITGQDTSSLSLEFFVKVLMHVIGYSLEISFMVTVFKISGILALFDVNISCDLKSRFIFIIFKTVS